MALSLAGAVLLVPRLFHVENLWKSKGSVEGIVTASFFEAAGIAAFVGLSPIVGAFAVGMAVASTRVINKIEEYVDKLGIIFAPLFFAIIGAQVNLRGVNMNVFVFICYGGRNRGNNKTCRLRTPLDAIPKRQA